MLSRAHVRPFMTVAEDGEVGRRPDREDGIEGGREAGEVGELPAEGRLELSFLRDHGGRSVAFLDRLCRLCRRLEGRPRSEVVEALRRQERRVRDARRLAGLTKSLLDRCAFRPPPGADRAEEVRETLYRARGERWPPTPGDLRSPYRVAAKRLGLDEAEVDRLLFADRPDARLLARAPRLSGEQLLRAYNLDLARGVLLDAERVVITARGGWRAIFRAVKLARLMYRIERVAGSAGATGVVGSGAGPGQGRGSGGDRATYRVELTGPAASFLAHPTRYGARFARVVPAVSRAPGWRLEAAVEQEGRRLLFELDGRAPVAGSRGRGRPSHDSGFERSLARDFSEKVGRERGGWALQREGTPVDLGEELFLPDFTFRHADGREALVEIVGFWTPEYLERKVRAVAQAGLPHLVLVVYDALAQSDDGRADDGAPVLERLDRAFPGRVIRFARKPVLRDVMAAVEEVATSAT